MDSYQVGHYLALFKSQIWQNGSWIYNYCNTYFNLGRGQGQIFFKCLRPVDDLADLFSSQILRKEKAPCEMVRKGERETELWCDFDLHSAE